MLNARAGVAVARACGAVTVVVFARALLSIARIAVRVRSTVTVVIIVVVVVVKRLSGLAVRRLSAGVARASALPFAREDVALAEAGAI